MLTARGCVASYLRAGAYGKLRSCAKWDKAGGTLVEPTHNLPDGPKNKTGGGSDRDGSDTRLGARVVQLVRRAAGWGISGFWGGFCGCLMLISLASLVPATTGPLEPIAHFRVHLAGLLVVSAGVSLLLRHYKWIMAHMGLALAVMLSVWAIYAPAPRPLDSHSPDSRSLDPHLLATNATPQSTTNTTTTTILWANLSFDQSALGEFAAMARAHHADVVAFTEPPALPPALAEAYFPDLPCKTGPYSGTPFAVVILTRGPCGDSGRVSDDSSGRAVGPLTGEDGVTLREAVVWAKTPRGVRVIGTHPPRGAPNFWARRRRDAPAWRVHVGQTNSRNRVIHAAFDAVDTRETTVLIGDWNTTPWATIMARARRDGFRPVMCRHKNALGAAGTWPEPLAFAGFPIDLVYVPQHARARCVIGSNVGSDHSPLIVTVGIGTARY